MISRNSPGVYFEDEMPDIDTYPRNTVDQIKQLIELQQAYLNAHAGHYSLMLQQLIDLYIEAAMKGNSI